MTSRALPQLEEDNRLLPMLSGLSKRYLGQDYSSKKSNVGKITAEMIDSVRYTVHVHLSVDMNMQKYSNLLVTAHTLGHL